MAIGNYPFGIPFESIDLPGNDYPYFKQEFERLTKIRLDLYKENQMKRRINTLILRKGLHTYKDFIHLLESNAGELAAFIDYITINVTEFFRTPNQWEVFEKEVIADLAASGQPIRIWSCACSTGEEPYSLAMSMLKRAPAADFRILATDIDEKVLNRAKTGAYDEKLTESLQDEMAERFFVKYPGIWAVNDEIRAHVDFKRLDLLCDLYPENCDLIVCRNVLIYFTEEAKDMIYTRFVNSLRPGGYLFTGNTEQIIYYKKTGLQKITNYLYRKM